jgi:16S rRNA (adenine1518-N6/adenine1519-N6)-dimethyltransferase
MVIPKKSLGQNFLIDKNIVKKIVKLGKIENNNVLEIGPGTGNLTDEIIKNKPKSLTLVEKDNKLCNILKEKFNKNEKISLLNNDILKINLEKIIKKDTLIFGNLPYNISTQILINFIKFKIWPPNYTKLILMFQKEVADKLLAKHNSSKFGRITVISNWRFKIVDNFNISKSCFYPKPKIDSSVLVFEPYLNKEFKVLNINNLENITRVLFSNKRKMINKGFAKLFSDYKNIADNLELNLSSRPGELKNIDFYKIAEFYEKYKKIN